MKPRAPKTKTKLRELFHEQSESGFINTKTAIQRLRKDHSKTLDSELEDIIEYGLSEIAGQVKRSRPADRGNSLMAQLGLTEFYNLHSNSGKRTNNLVPSKTLTVKQCLENLLIRREKAKKSKAKEVSEKDAKSEKILREEIKKGNGDIAIGEL